MIRHAVWMEAEQTDPYMNLAIEQQLLRNLPADTAILYLWQNAHTIVIGRNQDPWNECRVKAFMEDGGRIARRYSGGGAVYHDLGNLNYTLIVPQEHFSYSAQMGMVLRAVASLGLNPSINGRNDLVIDGRKFSGNAFQIHKGAACHHGTLLVCSDTAMMERWLTADKSKLASHGIQSVGSRIVNLSSFCPSVEIDRVKRALLCAFANAFGLLPLRKEQSGLDQAAVRETAAQLASAQWLFPETPDAPDLDCAQRFLWGSLRMLLWRSDDVIQRVVLYTDSLELNLFSLMENVLSAIRWEKGNTAQYIEKMLFSQLNDSQRSMLSDVLKWLETVIN